MGDLSKNLSRWEMTCRCKCGFNTVDHALVEILQDAADHFKSSLAISGGNRCRCHNDKLREDHESSGGKRGANTAEHSQHIYGRAADFRLSRVSDGERIDPYVIYGYLDAKHPDSLGIGLYSNRVHVDTKTGKARRWVV